MKRMKGLPIKESVACALAIFAILALQTTAPGKLAGNKLAGNKLSPYSAVANSAAASTLAASPIAAGQLGPNRYAANSEATREFIATSEGREVLSFIVNCALPEGTTLIATLPDGSPFEFLGGIGLANEWLNHPLRKAGRGW